MSLKSMVNKHKRAIKEVLANDYVKELIENKNWSVFYDPYGGLWDALDIDFIETDSQRFEIVNTITCMLLAAGVNIFENMTRIRSYSFSKLNLDEADMKILHIPENITEFGSYVFDRAYIPILYLPLVVEDIEYDTFSGAHFDEIHYPGTLAEFFQNYGNLLDRIAKQAKLFCTDSTTIITGRDEK